jgi:predicted ATPase/DNA-binding SARP family transcriptional activator
VADVGTGVYRADNVYLRLFGQPVINAGAEEHPLAPERRHQLLAYLACREGWVPREEIADLFWESHADALARRNLRRLLHDVRRIPWLSGFESQADALRWRVPSDRSGFARALARADWRESVRLGPGTLLAGIERGATDAFHDWLRDERQAQLERWRESVVRRRGELGGDAAARIELARFALDHDPFNEAALQDLVEVLHASGRHDEAEEAYARFAGRIQEELGVAPAVIARAPEPAPAAPSTGSARAVPACGTLIGRRLEQGQMVETLRRDDCRRATILGPGGVGKTSLAASARALLRGDFPDGVLWVSLRDLVRGAQVPARIAEACGLKGALGHDPAAALASRLGERRVLLVLDNCEHLPEVGAVGDVLVGACPNVKILHASRARIGCAGEFLLPLAGLAVPDAEEHELDVLRAFDSIRLFEARARQVDPAFELERCGAEVAQLVRMVEGLPLAIEMAAACTRLLPPAEIVRDISSLLDLRETPAASPDGTPGATRSLRASFEHSWRLLSAGEQRILAQLAVFDASFSAEAARSVAGAGIAELAALSDKSLVAANGEGRFALHPLVRELARERLDDEHATRDRHAAHFAGIMAWRAQAKRPAAAPWAFEDVTHCLEAWRWVAASGELARMQRMAIPLVRLFNSFLRWEEGIQTFEAALAGLEGLEGAAAGRLRAALGYGLALCRFYNGEMAAAEEAARRSLRLCTALRIRSLVPAADLHIIGSSLAWRGESVQARRFLEQSLALAHELAEPESVAKARYGLAFLEQAAGHWPRARELYAETAKLSAAIAMPQWQALALNGLGTCWLAEDRIEEALECFAEGIRVCTEHEVHGRRSFLLANHGLALLRANDPTAAARSIERALREAREWNICTATMESHLARCSLALARGDLELARADVRAAMQVACRIQSALRRLGVVRHWGQWLAAAGRRAEARAVLEFVRAHALAMRKDRDAAAEWLANAPAERSRNAPSLTMALLETQILDPNPSRST